MQGGTTEAGGESRVRGEALGGWAASGSGGGGRGRPQGHPRATEGAGPGHARAADCGLPASGCETRSFCRLKLPGWSHLEPQPGRRPGTDAGQPGGHCALSSRWCRPALPAGQGQVPPQSPLAPACTRVLTGDGGMDRSARTRSHTHTRTRTRLAHGRAQVSATLERGARAHPDPPSCPHPRPPVPQRRLRRVTREAGPSGGVAPEQGHGLRI